MRQHSLFITSSCAQSGNIAVYGAYTSSAADRVTVLTHVLYPATVESYNIGLAHFNVRFPTVVRQHSLFITSSCAQSGNIWYMVHTHQVHIKCCCFCGGGIIKLYVECARCASCTRSAMKFQLPCPGISWPGKFHEIVPHFLAWKIS